jgi:succinoglycan biosynthesis protein ExoA
MRISVIIISYQRPSLLRRCLESLAELEPLDYEVFLLINGTDPSSLEVAQEIQSRSGTHPLYLFQTSRQNLGAARNFLITKVTPHLQDNDWLFFLDDDAFLRQGFGEIAKKSLRLASNQKMGLVGGPNLSPPQSTPFEHLTGHWLSSPLIVGPVSRRYQSRPSEALPVKDDNCLILCNLFISKANIPEKPFSDFSQGGEENIFFQSYFFQGRSAFFCSDLAVFHSRRPTFPLFLQQIFIYGQGRGQTFRHSRQNRYVHLVPLFALILVALSWLLGKRDLFNLLIGFYSLYVFTTTCHIALVSTRAMSLLSAFGIPLIHLFYALGTFRGLFLKSKTFARFESSDNFQNFQFPSRKRQEPS